MPKIDNTNTIKKAEQGDYVVPIWEALDPTRKDLETYPTGFDSLDEAMDGGLKDGDLMVISGKSGNGKTLMAQNLVANLEAQSISTVFFSYEVIIDNVYNDFMEMGMSEKPAIYTPKENITGNIEWIEKKIDEAIQKFKTKIVVIDHLDFITEESKNDDYRRNQINNIVTKLKNIAKKKEVAVILLAHVVKTKDKVLKNEDIADSRAINNLADYIMFVRRIEDEDGMAIGNSGQAKLSKNRFTGKQIFFKFEVEHKVISEVDIWEDDAKTSLDNQSTLI